MKLLMENLFEENVIMTKSLDTTTSISSSGILKELLESYSAMG